MIRRFIALLTALFMLTACTAVFAESTEAPAADVATEPVLLVTVNGEQVSEITNSMMGGMGGGPMGGGQMGEMPEGGMGPGGGMGHGGGPRGGSDTNGQTTELVTDDTYSG